MIFIILSTILFIVLAICIFRYGVLRVWSGIKTVCLKLYELAENEWLREKKYALPTETALSDAVKDLHITSYVARPKWKSVKGDYIIFELGLRLQDQYADRIEFLKDQIEQEFRDVCVVHTGSRPVIFVKYLDCKKLVVWISQNRHGDRIVDAEAMKDDERKVRTENDPMMDSLKSELPVLGYDLNAWDDYSYIDPVDIDFRRYPGLLLTGPSGSGKSVALTVLLSELLDKFKGQVGSIYYLDFKSASESRYLADFGYAHYYCGEECAKGLEDFYNVFQDIRRSGRGNDAGQKINLLIFDEAAAFLLSEKSKGKEGKAVAEKHQDILTQVSLLGRSYKSGIWYVCQQPSSELTGGTAFRESLHSKVCFLSGSGGLSQEMKRMVGIDDDTAMRIREHGAYAAGAAAVLRQGKPTVIAQVPYIDEITVYQKKVLLNLPTA